MTLHATVEGSNPPEVVFNEPVTLDRAVTYLWGSPPSGCPDPLRVAPFDAGLGGMHRRFQMNCSAEIVLMIRDAAIMNALVQGSVIRPAPAPLPAWLPQEIQTRIRENRIAGTITRFPGTAPWGDIVVWQRRSGRLTETQVYQEFPGSLEFWTDLAGGDRTIGRRLQELHTEFNSDMRFFLEEGRSPEQAREEIRRINDQILRMIVGASVMMLQVGASSTRLANTLRSNARQIGAMEQGAHGTAREALRRVRRSRGL